MPKKRILILGAGLGGLSAAWHLQRKGMECHIFEKESEAGGLCRSKKIGDFIFDYDGHVLHFKHAAMLKMVQSLLGDNLAEHRRNAWVYSFGAYSHYPFQANLYGFPATVIKECLSGFIRAHNNGHNQNRNNHRFSHWINQNFGKGIARHFMVPYNTKFWTLPPAELTCEWLDGFIPVPNLEQVIEGAIEESRRQFGYSSRFWYPKTGGIAQLPLALASQIRNIHTNCPATKIDLSKKEIKLSSKDKERYDYLISTIPLPEMLNLIGDVPGDVALEFKNLKWNSILNLNLGIEKNDSYGRHWVYFPQEEISFFRVGFFHNFSSTLAPKGKDSLYIEVSYSKHKPINKGKIILQIKRDLEKVGIISQNDRILAQDINDIKYGYPIYDAHYNYARRKIFSYLTRKSIIPCGRYGSWRYMSMEDTLLDGREISRTILK